MWNAHHYIIALDDSDIQILKTYVRTVLTIDALHFECLRVFRAKVRTQAS